MKSVTQCRKQMYLVMNPTKTRGAATSNPREGLYSVAWVVEGTTGHSGGLLAAIDQIGCVGKKSFVVGLGEPPEPGLGLARTNNFFRGKNNIG